VDRPGQVIFLPLALFAHVNQRELVAAIEPGFHFVDRGLAYAGLCVIDNLKETRWMIRSHATSSRQSGMNESILSKPNGGALIWVGGGWGIVTFTRDLRIQTHVRVV
jgi:hypothetical protein